MLLDFGRQAGTRRVVLLLTLLAGLVNAPQVSSRSAVSSPDSETSLYAVLGPEAPSILRVLIGDSNILVIQPGTLDAAIKQHPIGAFVLSEDWADASDLKTAQAAHIRIMYVQRHVTVKAIEANIRALAALSGTQQAGERWIRTIDDGLTRIQLRVQNIRVMRVLILTPEGYTQGQGTLITDLLRHAGGINVAAEAGIPEARQLDDSQIRQFAPDVVLLIGWTPQAALTLVLNPLYRGIPPFDRDRVYRIAPPGKDPLNLVEDAEKMANLIHPLVF
jgi:ABC-type Fe3+-hydroxamate transport system substrate-binding protein